MVTCPLCAFGNPAGSPSCARCGQYLSATHEAHGAPATLVDRVRSDAPDTVERDVEPPAAQTPMPVLRIESSPTLPPGSALHKGLHSSGVAAAATVREPVGARADRGAVTASGATRNNRRSEVAVQPRLVIVRGERLNATYLVLEGRNYVGRSADRPVDIDLDGQEPVERVWTSRQHAAVTWERGTLSVEDLNSLNGTFVNRARIHPGQRVNLQSGDIIQIGTVQMKVVLE